MTGRTIGDVADLVRSKNAGPFSRSRTIRAALRPEKFAPAINSIQRSPIAAAASASTAIAAPT